MIHVYYHDSHYDYISSITGFLGTIYFCKIAIKLFTTEKITRVPKHVKVAMTLYRAHLESQNFAQFVLGVLRVSSALQSTDKSNEQSPFAIWFKLAKPVAKK